MKSGKVDLISSGTNGRSLTVETEKGMNADLIVSSEVKLPCYGIVVSWDSETFVGKIKTDQEVVGSEFDGIFSMILAHAIAGVDIESPAYIEGIETAVEAVGNNV
jgi:hypothetical protein